MQGKTIEDIRPWILGPEGSNVTLAIRRGGNQLSGTAPHRCSCVRSSVSVVIFLFSGSRMAQFNVTLARKAAATAAAAAQRPLYQEQRAPA